MEHRKLGYIRVSSKDQNKGRQLDALRKMDINERDIYFDKQSSKILKEQTKVAKTGCTKR